MSDRHCTDIVVTAAGGIYREECPGMAARGKAHEDLWKVQWKQNQVACTYHPESALFASCNASLLLQMWVSIRIE